MAWVESARSFAKGFVEEVEVKEDKVGRGGGGGGGEGDGGGGGSCRVETCHSLGPCHLHKQTYITGRQAASYVFPFMFPHARSHKPVSPVSRAAQSFNVAGSIAALTERPIPPLRRRAKNDPYRDNELPKSIPIRFSPAPSSVFKVKFPVLFTEHPDHHSPTTHTYIYTLIVLSYDYRLLFSFFVYVIIYFPSFFLFLHGIDRLNRL